MQKIPNILFYHKKWINGSVKFNAAISKWNRNIGINQHIFKSNRISNGIFVSVLFLFCEQLFINKFDLTFSQTIRWWFNENKMKKKKQLEILNDIKIDIIFGNHQLA